jgi:hypothetical protein
MLQQYPDDAEVVIRLPYSKLYRWVNDTYLDMNGRAVVMVELGGDPVVGAKAYSLPEGAPFR